VLVSSSLVLRQAALAAANLTTNEWLNRKRYPYLQHEAAGFCNRFDRGAAHNCWQFWAAPRQDWWRLWEEGDQVRGGGLPVGGGAAPDIG
jgi:hypothetical protein